MRSLSQPKLKTVSNLWKKEVEEEPEVVAELKAADRLMMMPPRSDKLTIYAEIAVSYCSEQILQTYVIITIHNSAINQLIMFKLGKLLANTLTYNAIKSLETSLGSFQVVRDFFISLEIIGKENCFN